MFLRVTKQKGADGAIIANYQLAESYWDKKKKAPRTRIIHNFRCVEDERVVDNLKPLARDILRKTSPEEIVAENADWHVLDAWPPSLPT